MRCDYEVLLWLVSSLLSFLTDCNSLCIWESCDVCCFFKSSVWQQGLLPFLLMSSSLRFTKLAMVVGRLDRSLSGMLSFFRAWQLKSCYGNTGVKQWNIIVFLAKSQRHLAKRGEGKKMPAGDTCNLMLWKSTTVSAALFWEKCRINLPHMVALRDKTQSRIKRRHSGKKKVQKKQQ